MQPRDLIRETGAGVVVAPDDVEGLRAALEGMHARFREGGLPAVRLDTAVRRRLSREARVEELAELLRELVR